MTDTLAGKLAKIMGQVEGFAPDGRNNAQNFNFISINQIEARVRPLLAEAGIIAVQKTLDRTFEEGQTRSGSAMTQCYLTVEWRFTDGSRNDDGTATDIVAITVGEAHDTGDKAANKAMTASFKQFLKAIFMVTEADGDNDASPNQDREPRQQHSAARSSDQGHGVCLMHDEPFRQSEKQRNTGFPPSHKDGDRWCAKGEPGTVEVPQPPASTANNGPGVTCPRHGVAWTTGQYGRKHPVPGGECSAHELFKATLNEVFARLSWTDSNQKMWLEKFFGGALPVLKTDQLIEANQTLRLRPTPTNKDEVNDLFNLMMDAVTDDPPVRDDENPDYVEAMAEFEEEVRIRQGSMDVGQPRDRS